MDCRENVRIHMRKFFDVEDMLEDTGVKINENLLIILLYNLPENYENFRSILEFRHYILKADIPSVK